MNSKYIPNISKLHRLLMEQSRDIIFVADEQGRFLEIGGRGTARLGYGHEVLSRLSLQDLIFPRDAATSLLNVEELPVDQVVARTCRLRCWDGKLLWTEMSVLRMPDGRLTGIFCPAIPAWQRALDKPADKGRNSYLIDKSPWMHVLTLHDDFPEVIDCNQRFLDTLGYSRSEMIGKPLASFYVPESADSMLKSGYSTFLSGQFEDHKHKFITRNGQIVHTILHSVHDEDVDGMVVGTHAIYLDITEQIQIEESLRRSEHRFSMIFQFSPIGITIADSGSSLLLEINQAGLQIVGYTREEVVGHKTLDIGFWENPSDRQRLLDRLESTGKVVDFETIFVHKSGAKRHVLLSADQVYFDGMPNLLIQFTDITERKRSELLEVEQRSIAFELHDGLAQINASIHQHLQAFAHDYRPRSPRAKKQLDFILDLAQTGVREVRHVIAGLRPTALDDFGLVTALRLLIQSLEVAGWDIDYRAPESLERWPQIVETVLFRVAQESLTNIRKHAQTTRVQVVLELKPQCYALEIKDWGRGFSVPAATAATTSSAHLGLEGMRQRLLLVGGALSIQSTPGIGTQIIAEIPHKL